MSELEIPGVKTTEVSMILPDKLTFEMYDNIGRSLASVADFSALRLPWYIGAWLNYGENKFPDRYSQAIHFTGLSYQTLCNYSYTERHVPVHVRRPSLGIAVHHEVASIKDTEKQDEILRAAQENGWNKSEVRAAVRGKPPKKALPDKMPSFREEEQPTKLITFDDWYFDNEEILSQAEGEVAAYRIVWEAARQKA